MPGRSRVGLFVVVLHLGQASGEEVGLHLVVGEGQRRAVGGGGLVALPELAQEVGSGRGQVGIVGQLRLVRQGIECKKPGGGAGSEPDGNRVIQTDDGDGQMMVSTS